MISVQYPVGTFPLGILPSCSFCDQQILLPLARLPPLGGGV